MLAQNRRYFLESEKDDPERAAHALEVFKQLNDVEREIMDGTADERKKARQELAKLYGQTSADGWKKSLVC